MCVPKASLWTSRARLDRASRIHLVAFTITTSCAMTASITIRPMARARSPTNQNGKTLLLQDTRSPARTGRSWEKRMKPRWTKSPFLHRSRPMPLKTTAIASAFLLLAGLVTADEPESKTEKLAEAVCTTGSQEYRLALTQQVLQESTLSSRLVVLAVERSATTGTAEPRRIWQDFGHYLSGVFPRPAWSGTLLCGRLPGQVWLMMSITNGLRVQVRAYTLDLAATGQTFPDPQAYVGKLIREEERVKPVAEWNGELAGDGCGVRSVEAKLDGDDVLVQLNRHDGGCAPLRVRLNAKTSRFEEVASGDRSRA